LIYHPKFFGKEESKVPDNQTQITKQDKKEKPQATAPILDDGDPSQWEAQRRHIGKKVGDIKPPILRFEGKKVKE
jgi:hypothetical protein